MNVGKVYLVGAGPGDINLITVKGLQCIKKADVILYDRLVNPVLLEEARQDVEFIYCGKLPKQHIVRQDRINELLVKKSKEGKTVVRLKGGDPSIFGRVGEEAEILGKQGIPYEIVPGITSGIAASIYAGIPVTHRDYATSFAVVTGHDKSKTGEPSVHWDSLATGVDTIAFYMGIGNLDFITKQLMSHGKQPTTPVILIQWGTYSSQKTLEGTLATICQLAKEVNFKNPAITLVGPIVALRDKLKWFENKALYGKNIIIARTTSSESWFAEALKDHGADVFQFPRFAQQPLLFEAETMKKFRKLSIYKQIVFTCPTSVKLFFQGLSLYGIDIRSINAQFYAKNGKTQLSLRRFGCTSKLDNELSLSSSLLVVGEKLSDGSGAPINQRLDYLATHRNNIVPQTLETLKRLETEGMLNTIVFSSAKSVEVFLAGLKDAHIDRKSFFLMKSVVTLGLKATAAAVAAGISIEHRLKEQNVELLVEALKEKNISTLVSK